MATRYCNFCYESEHTVPVLIASEQGEHICNACVALCVEIINAKFAPGEVEYQSWLEVLRSPYRVVEFGAAYHWPEPL